MHLYAALVKLLNCYYFLPVFLPFMVNKDVYIITVKYQLFGTFPPACIII